jgi:uncharacterized damage-inducible protein DinB
MGGSKMSGTAPAAPRDLKSPDARNKGGDMAKDQALREMLLGQLDGGQAHLLIEQALAAFPPQARGQRVGAVPHTAWRLLEHMRLCQRDILEYTRDAAWQSPPWPDGFWPEGDAPPNRAAWDGSVEQFFADQAAMRALVADPQTDLLQPLPHGEAASHNVARQAMLLVDHNAYHLGQLVMLARALGVWD